MQTECWWCGQRLGWWQRKRRAFPAAYCAACNWDALVSNMKRGHKSRVGEPADRLRLGWPLVQRSEDRVTWSSE